VRAIAARVGPIAATSANRHGEPVAVTAAEVRAVFGAGVDVVVDGGALGASSSTVVDATGWPWVLLRAGPVDGDAVLAVAAATRASAG
jgi:tRNA A37 threonylcarbamoyladenosine synthetase subunit TsaC/SUA5/YrdC